MNNPYGQINPIFKGKHLADLCIGRNGIQTGPFGSLLHKDDYVENGLPIITVEHLGDNGRISRRNLPLVSDNDKNRLSKFILKEGDIVFSRVGSVDRNALVTAAEEGWLFSGRCLRIRPNSTIINPAYLSYFLRLTEFKHYISRMAVGGTMPSLNTQILSRIPIFYPPLPEQRKIAAILGAWGEAITLTEQLIAALQQRKKGLMQRLLTGEVRFPGFVPKANQGDYPINWDVVYLADKFKRIDRKVGDKDIDFFLSITATIGFADQREKFGKVIAGKNKENYIHLIKGEFAYNKGNSDAYPEGCIYRLEEFEEGGIPNVYFAFSPNSSDIIPSFYKHYFESGAMNRQLRKYISSSARSDGLFNISAHDFFNVFIPVPPKDEQIRIAALFELIDKEISLQSEKLSKLQQQKKGLMQRLLTGEVRVKI